MFLAWQISDDLVVEALSRTALVLHEDEVPDLQIALLVHRRAALAPVVRPAVIPDLRVGPARARHAHVPVVVRFAHPLDPALGQAHLVPPDAVGLVVVLVDRDPEPVLREAEPPVVIRSGQQIPGPGDRVVLEVVAERPAAEHLEERAGPGVRPDSLDVDRAQALLRAGRPVIRRPALAEQVGQERDHAGHHEQQRRILRYEAGRGHHRVPSLLEIGQETACNLCRLHQRPSFRSWVLVLVLRARQESRCGRPGGPGRPRWPRSSRSSRSPGEIRGYGLRELGAAR